jgi:hypothetical protein
MPLFKRMHEMTVDHVHEEIQLLALDFSTMLYETMGVMPSWKEWYVSHDQTPHYAYLKKVLQALQWQRPGAATGRARWVLKSPQHVEQFAPLVEVFPDATFVVTHCTGVGRVLDRDDDPYTAPQPRRGRPASHRRVLVTARRRCRTPMRSRASVRSHHRRALDEFMADDVAMVERIYDVAGQPFDAGVRSAMDAFMVEHPRGRHGGVLYDLEGDFGLDAGEIRRAMRPYTDRFGVELEHDV